MLLVRRVMQKKLAWEPRGTKEVVVESGGAAAAAETGEKIKGERWCRRSGWTGAWRGRKKGKKSKRRRTNKRKKFQNSYVSIGRVCGGVLISIKSLSSARIPFETERERGEIASERGFDLKLLEERSLRRWID